MLFPSYTLTGVRMEERRADGQAGLAPSPSTLGSQKKSVLYKHLVVTRL